MIFDFELPSWFRYPAVFIGVFGAVLIWHAFVNKLGVMQYLMGLVALALGGVLLAHTEYQPRQSFISAFLEGFNEEAQRVEEEPVAPVIDHHANWQIEIARLDEQITAHQEKLQKTAESLRTDYDQVRLLYLEVGASAEADQAYRVANARYSSVYAQFEADQKALVELGQRRQHLAAHPPAPAAPLLVSSTSEVAPPERAEVNLAAAKQRVVMYSTSWSEPCEVAGLRLGREGIPFETRLIDESTSARAEFDALGGKAVPFFVVDGQRVSQGLDISLLREALKDE